MKVLLLAGGNSSERKVSLTSGKAVHDALAQLGHSVVAVDPASGQSLLAADGSFLGYDSKSDMAPATEATSLSFPQRLDHKDVRDVDVAFIALHGGTGENGSIQNLLELASIKFTGSNMAACAVSMDKAITKRLCENESIPTPKWEQFRMPEGRVPDGLAAGIVERFNLPIIVKPNDSGSTVGLTKVEHPDEIQDALKLALAESPDILVEQYIDGREITVALLDGRTFPVVEIIPKSGLYDYEAKYTEGGSKYICPAEIPQSIAEGVQAAAARLFGVIGCAGLARVDFMLSGDGIFYCLELNSVPGMTDLSLVPMAAKADGIDFPQLMQMALDSALGNRNR
ncbi:MAG: D-alanine--D-alanine ligase [candidate division Zixibacteria bacterium]|nr:D-alanine--D-alanine ligase [candidate division Zixibacteria bacterium]MDH3939056.1 D-alanine--D-alanine ligase [candidate division Zixibacteria bacterium]